MNFDIDCFPDFEIKIPHRNWQEALSQAFALLVTASPGDVVSITGPSRGGKSKLISELCSLLVGGAGIKKDGKMPVVIVEAVNVGPHGSFSTKAFIQRLLDALDHPILSNKYKNIDFIS